MANKLTVSIKQVDAKVHITEVVNVELGVRTAFNFIDKDDEDTIEVSDGHHTMDELYEHRHVLFLALVKYFDNYVTPLACNIKCWKSRMHDDGSSYEGWFLLGMTVTKPNFIAGADPEVFDISYHLPDRLWHMAKVIEREKAPPYTGYTSKDVIERIMRL